MTDPWILGPDADGLTLRIAGDRIEAVGGPELATEPSTLPCDGARIQPGFVNAHTHLYSGLAPLGMPPPEPPPTNFVEILERVWWRLDRALDRNSLRASARLYVARALLQGCTTLVDHHESPNLIDGSLDVLAEAFAELGGRALLTYGATERNGGLEEGRAGLAECRRAHDAWQSDTLKVLVGLHASFTVSDELIGETAGLCDALGAPLHIHLAEDLADVTDARDRGYDDPLHRLQSLGALPPKSVVAHAVHLTPEKVEAVADAGAWLVHNPRSNENNAVGFATSLAATPRVALGTDGFPADMPTERDAGARLLGDHDQPETLADARLDASRALAADLFGLPFDLSGGAAADLVVRDPRGSRHVVSAGRVVVRDHRLATADIESIESEARSAAASLWRRMRTL